MLPIQRELQKLNRKFRVFEVESYHVFILTQQTNPCVCKLSGSEMTCLSKKIFFEKKSSILSIFSIKIIKSEKVALSHPVVTPNKHIDILFDVTNVAKTSET